MIDVFSGINFIGSPELPPEPEDEEESLEDGASAYSLEDAPEALQRMEN